MNHPTSDVQFLAAMLIKVRNSDQIGDAEAARLDSLARTGTSFAYGNNDHSEEALRARADAEDRPASATLSPFGSVARPIK